MSEDINTPDTASRRDRVAGPAADDPLADQEEFEQLAAHISALPASLEPERELWSGIEAGLSPRQTPLRRSRRTSTPWRRSAPAGRWSQALAAAVGLAVGVAVTWLVMSGAGGMPGAGAPDGTLKDGTLRTASSAASLDGVETQFLRAKEELWLVAFERRDELSPEAWSVVQQNLQILDSAISNLRSALAEDPDNSEIRRRLLRNQRRSLDLLRDVTSGLASDSADPDHHSDAA